MRASVVAPNYLGPLSGGTNSAAAKQLRVGYVDGDGDAADYAHHSAE